MAPKHRFDTIGASVDRESVPVKGVHSNGVNSTRGVPVQRVRSQARMRPRELL